MLNLLAQMLIRLYKLLISPFLPRACRFLPTCSDYALEALQTHGLLRGGLLGAKRLCRCHPWGASGYDPVPSPASRPLGSTLSQKEVFSNE